uniref:Transmembrane protein n=1 Tax=Schizaphis graminum TaxID=13262 RepID=A0A2S2N9K5_SCHGA
MYNIFLNKLINGTIFFMIIFSMHIFDTSQYNIFLLLYRLKNIITDITLFYGSVFLYFYIQLPQNKYRWLPMIRILAIMNYYNINCNHQNTNHDCTVKILILLILFLGIILTKYIYSLIQLNIALQQNVGILYDQI